MIPTVLAYDHPDTTHAVAFALEVGQTMIFPTDTIYGIGGNPWDARPLGHVRRLKQRPEPLPFTLHLPSVELVERFAQCNEHLLRKVQSLLPGPYTLLLPASKEAPASSVSEGKVGIRVPDHPFFRDVLRQPVFATSVNKHNQPPLASVQEIIEQFSAVDLIVTGPVHGAPSAILDLTGAQPQLLRGEVPPPIRALLEQE